MLIKNIWIYGEDHRFHFGDIELKDDIISGIYEHEEEAFDIGKMSDNDRMIIPGMIDIHFHGCIGADLSDANKTDIGKIAEYEAKRGITTICPATMTVSEGQLHRIMSSVGEYRSETGARFAGVNMEGPFISKRKKGAQAEENIIPCSEKLFRELQLEAKGRIRLIDIAPEENGAMEFIDALKDDVIISLAHTEADYDTASEAFRRGARHVTHICNAMPPLDHRRPGLIGAAADYGASVELISDGIHIHPAMVRTLFKVFGSEKICMISDTMRAAGLEDGNYTLGGQEVFVKGAKAVLKDGTLAGSVTDLMGCFKTAVLDMNIPIEDAVRCVTENPARVIGIIDRCGSISVGKYADILLMDKKLELQEVIIGGKRLV